jgi:hypothetical protein
MAIVLRRVKGSNLTPDEVDNNFEELAERLASVEDNPPDVNEISNITLDGSEITIHLEDGSTFGPFQLPVAVMQWRGDFAAVDYEALDIVRVPGSGVYMVLQDHTGVLPFDPDLQVSGSPAYHFLFGEASISPGWVTLPFDAGIVEMDFAQGDKFICVVDADALIKVPVNPGDTAPPFVLRIQIALGTGDPEPVITFDPLYLGDPPTVLTGDGDETVLSGMILDTEESPGTTAFINSIKFIPAPA